MDFSLSEEQGLLKDSVERYLEKEYGFAERTRIVRDGGWSAERWKAMADLGWLAAPFPEELGGLGGGGPDVGVIMDRFGRRLVLEPFVWSVVVGGRLLSRGLEGEQRDEVVGRLVAGELQLGLAVYERRLADSLADIETTAAPAGDGWAITGEKPLALNGAAADFFLVSARASDGLGVFLVARDASGVSVEPYQTHDGHNAAALRLNGAAAGVRVGGMDLLEEALDWGRAALCAEAAGSAAYLLEATSAYLKQRVQYDKPLAQFQALQHRLADMYVAAESARSMALVAAMSLERSPERRMRDVSAAKVEVGRSAKFVAQQAVQLHGGMGVSEELDVAHHLKRITAISLLLGDERYHLRRFADLSEALGESDD